MKISASAFSLAVIFLLATGSHAVIQGCNEYGPNLTNGTETCRTCNTLTFFNNATFATACVNCPSPCLSCTGALVCTSCQAGYYLNGATCISCGDNCSSCDGTSCSTCRSGYGLTNNRTCARCSDNCIDCTSDDRCTSCRNDYDLIRVNNDRYYCVDNRGLGDIWWYILGIGAAVLLVGAIAACFLCGRTARGGPEYATTYVPPQPQTTGYTQLIEAPAPRPPVLTNTVAKTTVINANAPVGAPPAFQQITTNTGYAPAPANQYIQTAPTSGSYYVQGAQPRVSGTFNTPGVTSVNPGQPAGYIPAGQRLAGTNGPILQSGFR